MDPQHGRLSRWFWGGFFLILVLGAVLAVFAAIRLAHNIALEATIDSDAPPVVVEAIRVILAPGESVLLDAELLAKTGSQALQRLEARRDQSLRQLSERLDQALAGIFERADSHLPAFADWYFSLKGEYTRLFYAAFGNLTAYLEGRLEALVLEPAALASAIDDLSAELGETSVTQVKSALAQVQALLMEVARQNSLSSEGIEVAGEWNLQSGVTQRFEPYLELTPEDIARQGVAASAGTAAAAVTAKKLGGTAVATAAAKLGAKSSAGAASTLAAKIGVKSAAKAGGALAASGGGAVTGAALCAGTVAGAPLSPGCALVGGLASGVATWLLVDKAVLEADEYLNREAFEAELRAALQEQRAALREQLSARYVAGTRAVFEQVHEELAREFAPRPIAPTRDFVPARAVAQ